MLAPGENVPDKSIVSYRGMVYDLARNVQSDLYLARWRDT